MKKLRSKTVLWLFCSHNTTAFDLGIKAKKSNSNPYLKNTNEWYSWNHGYNINQQNKLL